MKGLGKSMLIASAFLATILVTAADSPQFRGPNRDGLFPEKGLLKSWPESGPTVNWSFKELGKGFSSVAVVDGMIYSTGDLEDAAYVFALDGKGKLKWKTKFGGVHEGGGYPGARSTPTYDEGSLYVINGKGGVTSLDASTGKENWSVDTLSRFGAGKAAASMIPDWGISESVLIDGNNLICTPGAPDAAVVALNKKTGATVWTTKGLSDLSGYCCARLFEHGKLRQVITLTAGSMVGIDPANGKILWKQAYEASYGIHANLPLFVDDKIFVTDGYGQGSRMFQVASDGKSVKEVWERKELDVQHGNAVVVDGVIYGASNRRTWYALDAQTGEIKAKGKGTGKGVVIYADGLLYGYGERGHVGLIDPKADDLVTTSVFRLREGSGQHWAHPVISDGNLYVRHGAVLMSYRIK